MKRILMFIITIALAAHAVAHSPSLPDKNNLTSYSFSVTNPSGINSVYTLETYFVNQQLSCNVKDCYHIWPGEKIIYTLSSNDLDPSANMAFTSPWLKFKNQECQVTWGILPDVSTSINGQYFIGNPPSDGTPDYSSRNCRN